MSLSPSDRRHGTPVGYRKWGCRCDRCREAHRRDHLAYMHRSGEQREKHRERQRRAQ